MLMRAFGAGGSVTAPTGTIGGTGSVNKITKFTGAGTIGVSTLSDDGTTISRSVIYKFDLENDATGGYAFELKNTGFNYFRIYLDGNFTQIEINKSNGNYLGSLRATSLSELRTDMEGLDKLTAAVITFGGQVASGVQIGKSGGTLGFFGTTPATQGASAADLTNNVTSGGTDDTVDDVTATLTTAAELVSTRNAIYQLARKLKQVNDTLRTYGLLT